MNFLFNLFKSTLAVVLMVLICSESLNAQSLITGKVIDDGQIPLPGVIVRIKGSTQGTSTDSNGNFSIKATRGEIIEFKFIGYNTQEITLDRQTSLNVQMVADSKALDEVIVVGYGTQKKANLTGAVDQVGSEYFEDRPLNNITRGLQGVIPNLNIKMTDGKPTRGATYNIRGITSIGSGGSALVLVDGVPGAEYTKPE
ncbi:MAG: hypothetical protein B7X86_02160 [Sphingobacteriales bacterium 17-39-43]|uniref:carboxypeptidase-like regulatory domain-containing protein n=1 Tax=Daejeonella sp. TaxID=2805397 RepID=UPI000BCB0F82|nr:carboxypeptidase-like regulatory domain-containing protein [Daejeonella sp.]OYZ33147.1 MAG: hypothetical protein B7Y24_02160 [Sphingobacteriales bacterium 16-39-50]OZA26556.1 MAG: hypothetical protein B7X86_02160 [Sphingobacteriales bacterium 17-39-43]HQT21711.1 carboxypeptidase-like regulatory domain-containing protein [Daejeonella sp.]HQT56442.1 carboxypeptidase-like regulatory domain-containing protein [Daejeonella sp.]